jgi:hypothetical protein
MSAAADQQWTQEQILRAAIIEFGEFNIERLKIDVPTVFLRGGHIQMRVRFTLDDALHLCPLCEGRGLIERKEDS